MTYLRSGWLAAYALGLVGWLAIYELWGRGAVVVVALIGMWLAVVAGEAMHRYPDGEREAFAAGRRR